MSTVLIVIFAVLLAIFCIVGFIAPKFVTQFAHTEEEVLDGEVVANYRGQSIVRITTTKELCCMKGVLPLTTKVVVSIRDIKKPKNPRMYLAYGAGKLEAEVLCRLNKEVLLCRRCGHDIFVECNESDQAELTKVKQRVFNTFKSMGKTYRQTEDYLAIPVVSTDFHFDFKTCIRQA